MTIRIRPELKAKLEKLAEQDGRTISNYVERALDQHVEQASKRR
jgi:predicted transcriptional regulator